MIDTEVLKACRLLNVGAGQNLRLPVQAVKEYLPEFYESGTDDSAVSTVGWRRYKSSLLLFERSVRASKLDRNKGCAGLHVAVAHLQEMCSA